MEGIYVYPIFLFKIAGQSLLPCEVMVLLYYLTSLYCAADDDDDAIFLNMRARACE